jgi:hypothetical protein
LTLADPRVEQPSVRRVYLVPSFTTAQRGESEALEVLSHVLGGGSNSRIYRALVVDKRVAVSAGTWYQSSALDWTKFGFYGTPQPGVALTQLETDIEAVIAKLVEDGVSAEELERSKTRLIADAIYAQDSQSSLARWYGVALTTGGTEGHDAASFVAGVCIGARLHSARASHHHRKNRQPVGHRSMAGPRDRGAAGFAQLRLPRRIEPRPGGKSRRRQHGG